MIAAAHEHDVLYVMTELSEGVFAQAAAADTQTRLIDATEPRAATADE